MAYHLRPDKPFTAEFVAVAEQQLSKAVRYLADKPDGAHTAIHDARKRFNRVRALYRVIQPDAKEFRSRENTRIGDMARSLSAVRDATALVETVDYLAGQSTLPEEQAALAFARDALSKRRDEIAKHQEDLPARMATAVIICHEAIDALHGLSLDDRPEKTANRLAKVWKKQRLQAIAAIKECEGNAHAEAFHELRKSGQTYWMHLALLRDIWPSAMRAKQAEAKSLVDLLGHEHDLSVLSGLVNESPDLFGDSDTLARLLAAIIARQQALRKEALPIAQSVFSDSAATESKLVALLWKHAAS